MREDLSSALSFETLQTLHSRVSRHLKSYLIEYLSCNDEYGHLLVLTGKWRRLSSLAISLSKACNGILAQVEEKYNLPGLHVNFAKEKEAAQLKGLLTEDGLRGMSEERIRYAVDVVSTFVASFTDRSARFEASCILIRMIVQYSHIVNKVLEDHREERWVEGEFSKLQSETGEFKRVN